MRRQYLLVSGCLLSALLGSVLSAAEKAGKPGKSRDLFNGKDLSGWDFYLTEPAAKMQDVWSVQDGLLVCKGEPQGYLCTQENFKDFQLVVEWRWAPGKEPGNSGVLMRMTKAPQMLPRCVEMQLRSGNAGDLYGFQGFVIDGPADRKKEVPDHKLGGHLRGVASTESAEVAAGEWNRAEITVADGTITVSINGKQVNQATGCEVTAGPIALQSEGGEIHFRKVELRRVKSKPGKQK